MVSSRWKRFVDNLRAHPKEEAYLASTVLVLSWLILFLGIGRIPCSAYKAVNSAAIQRTSSVGTAMPKATQAAGLHPASNDMHTLRTCFGFNWPGTIAGDTLIWLAASFFPGSALLYSLFSILTRLAEIEDSAENTGTYYLYVRTPPPDTKTVKPTDPTPAQPRSQPADWNAFQTYLRARFREYYNPWEFIIFALSSGTLAIILAKLIIAKYHAAPWGEPIDIASFPVAFTAGAGLADSISGAFLLVLKRYRTFNMYPSTYLSVFVAIAAGTFAGALWHFVFTPSVAVFLAFGIAFLTSINLEYFVGLLTVTLAKNTGQTVAVAAKSDLDSVIQNPDAIDVLRTMSVFSIGEFIRTDPMRLYLNLPQAIGTIDGWIDTALLQHFFAHQVDALAMAGIRHFSQLLHRFAAKATAKGITWEDPAKLIEIDNVQMGQILATLKDVAENERYYRQLGVIWDDYLKGLFSPRTMEPNNGASI